MTRQELTEAVIAWLWDTTKTRYDLDERLVAKWERGVVRWPSAHYRAALRAVLDVATDRELGFCRPRRSAVSVKDVDRKQFLYAALGVGAGVVAGLPLADLVVMTEPTRVPSGVGRTEIESVRTSVRVFDEWDMLYGGGLAREAVTGQLRFSAKFLNARCPEPLRGDLFSAVGLLGTVAGFMAFDAYAHEDAHRLFRFALACAEEAGDWSLRASVLANMARHALLRGDAEASLTCIEHAQVRTDRLVATQRAMLASLRATTLAGLGRVEEAARTVGEADEEFSHSNPANDPPLVDYYNAAEHAGQTGHALSALTAHGRFADEASQRLFTAITEHGDGAARSRALAQVQLASLMMAKGDPREAAAIGATAVSAAGAIHSRRLNERLRALRQDTRAHTAIAEVSEFHHVLTTTISAD